MTTNFGEKMGNGIVFGILLTIIWQQRLVVYKSCNELLPDLVPLIRPEWGHEKQA